METIGLWNYGRDHGLFLVFSSLANRYLLRPVFSGGIGLFVLSKRFPSKIVNAEA